MAKNRFDEDYQMHLKTIKNKSELLIEFNGTTDDIIFMISQAVCALSKESGTETDSILNIIIATTGMIESHKNQN